MRKKIIKIAVLILTAAILLSVAAFAAETRASAQLAAYGASVVSTGNGNINIDFSVLGTGMMTKIGASVIQLYTSDGTLVETFSYTKSGNEYMMGYDTYTHAASVPYSGTSGQSYYAVVTFFGRNSSGADSKTYTTAVTTA